MQQYVAKVTEIMREADLLFETTGGGTRHYVRDLLLPMMEQAGLKIVDATPFPAQPPVNGEDDQGARDAAAEYADQPYIGVNAIDTRKFDAFLAGVKWAKGQASPAKAEQPDYEDLYRITNSAFAKLKVRLKSTSLTGDQVILGQCREIVDLAIERMQEIQAIVPSSKEPKAEQEGIDYKKWFEEANEFICDLAKAFDPDSPLPSWTIDDFLESAKTKFGEQEGLGWVRLTTAETLPPVDNGPFPVKYAVRYQVSDSNGNHPVIGQDWLTASEIAIECQGCDWFEYLLESAPKEAGQVDPVAFAEWVGNSWIWNGDEWTERGPSAFPLRKTTSELKKQYLESLNKQQ